MKKGISLVALVITIVVLVILTGTIILSTMNNDIFDNTQNQVNDNNKNQVIDNIKIKIQTEKMNKEMYGIYTLTMNEIIPILNEYGNFNSSTLKLETEKAGQIYLYEIMSIPLKEYAQIKHENDMLTITPQSVLSNNGYIIEYSINSGNTWNQYVGQVSTQGETGIQIRLLNNSQELVSDILKITGGVIGELDNTSPIIQIQPNGVLLAKNTQVTITVTDNERLASTNNYEYYLSTSKDAETGGSWITYTNGTAFAIGTNLTGTYYLHIKEVFDNEGNTSGNVVSQSYTFDNTIPYSFTPTIGEVTENSIEINASTSDNNGQAVTYYYSIDNGATWLPSGGTSATTYTFTNLTEGTTYNGIKVKVVDTVGNERISENITVSTIISKKYLYANGNQYNSITGGWTNGVSISIWGNGYSNSLTKIAPGISTNKMSLNLVGQSYFKYTDINTVNKIDLTNYTTLNCIYDTTATLYYPNMFVTSNLNFSTIDPGIATVPVKVLKLEQEIGSSYKATIDITDVNGEYYIGFVSNIGYYQDPAR